MAANMFPLSSSIIPIDDLDSCTQYSEEEKAIRRKLAAVYRLVDLYGWSELIDNHISVRAPGEDEHFLLNPFGLLYSEVTASSLVKVDLEGKVIDPGSTQLGAPLTGFVIHSAIHSARKDLKCIIHVHTAAGGAVSSMKCGILPMTMDSVTAGDISYHDFQGVSVDTKERASLVTDLGPVNKAMVLRNHGLLAMGPSIEDALETLIFMMRACESQLKAMSAVNGKVEELTFISDEYIKQIQDSLNGTRGIKPELNCSRCEIQFEALMRLLDRKGYNTGYHYRINKFTKPTFPSTEQV